MTKMNELLNKNKESESWNLGLEQNKNKKNAGCALRILVLTLSSLVVIQFVEFAVFDTPTQDCLKECIPITVLLAVQTLSLSYKFMAHRYTTKSFLLFIIKMIQ